MRFTTEELARATKGDVHGDHLVVDGASIDSRSVVPGQLFVPIVADRDGHDFVPAAVEGGAVAYLSDRGPVHGRVTTIHVSDTSEALTRLGALARDRLPEALIGITGSVGKTSVKDLLASVVATTFRTSASPRNFNNELGVPLTLINAADDTEVVVQEMGARGVGHIDHLCRVARPTGAVVTLVANVHTSEFAGLDDVAVGKAELVESVPADGFVVLNAQDPRVLAMRRHTDARVLTFGVNADVAATAVAVDEHLRPRFRLASPWGSVDVALRVHGVHHVANALAAAGAGLAQGVPLDAVGDGLRNAVLSPGRMTLHHLESGAVVIDDAYNASPTSVAAALHALAGLDARRHVAILGVMAELGPESDAHHADIGQLADRLDVELITVAAPAYGQGLDVPDVASAVEAAGRLGAGDAVLVKASRSAGLERVVMALVG